MRYKAVVRGLGLLILAEAALMFPSVIVSLLYQDGSTHAFIKSIVVLLVAGLPIFFFVRPNARALQTHDSFALVALGWIVLSLFGMLPFLFSGTIHSPIDAFFEAVSGFSTTSASVISNIEGLPEGILFWRCFMNWTGGMGVLVLTVALLPQLGIKNLDLFRAESPGPTPEKFLPRIRQSAKVLYGIYFGMSLLLFLLLMAVGLKPFDALVSAFSTAGTGGFSILNTSISGYNNVAAEIIIAVFMLLFGINFSIYFAVLVRQWKKVFSNQEFILYLFIVGISILVVAFNIYPQYQNVFQSLRYSLFQVAASISTTGYYTADYNLWPLLTQCILLLLMTIGPCSGSTGGGMKLIRLLIAAKSLHKEQHNLLHPRIFRPISVDKKNIEEQTVRSVLVFNIAYFSIIIVSTLVVSLDGFDFLTTFSSVIAAISNHGVGLGVIGPSGNHGAFSTLSKIVLSFCMLAGRLEIMPVMLLLTRSFWRRS